MQTQILNTIRAADTISMTDLVSSMAADENLVWDAVIALLDAGQIVEVADEVLQAANIEAVRVIRSTKTSVGGKVYRVRVYSNGDVEASRHSRLMTVSARMANISAIEAARACSRHGYHVDVDSLQSGQTATSVVEGFVVSVSRH